jgi:hypothetical protein
MLNLRYGFCAIWQDIFAGVPANPALIIIVTGGTLSFRTAGTEYCDSLAYDCVQLKCFAFAMYFPQRIFRGLFWPAGFSGIQSMRLSAYGKGLEGYSFSCFPEAHETAIRMSDFHGGGRGLSWSSESRMGSTASQFACNLLFMRRPNASGHPQANTLIRPNSHLAQILPRMYISR